MSPNVNQQFTSSKQNTLPLEKDEKKSKPQVLALFLTRQLKGTWIWWGCCIRAYIGWNEFQTPKMVIQRHLRGQTALRCLTKEGSKSEKQIYNLNAKLS